MDKQSLPEFGKNVIIIIIIILISLLFWKEYKGGKFTVLSNLEEDILEDMEGKTQKWSKSLYAKWEASARTDTSWYAAVGIWAPVLDSKTTASAIPGKVSCFG